MRTWDVAVLTALHLATLPCVYTYIYICIYTYMYIFFIYLTICIFNFHISFHILFAKGIAGYASCSRLGVWVMSRAAAAANGQRCQEALLLDGLGLRVSRVSGVYRVYSIGFMGFGFPFWVILHSLAEAAGRRF